MSTVNIYAEHDDIVSIRPTSHPPEYRVKIGHAWLYLPPPVAQRLYAALGDILTKDEGQS